MKKVVTTFLAFACFTQILGQSFQEICPGQFTNC